MLSHFGTFLGLLREIFPLQREYTCFSKNCPFCTGSILTLTISVCPRLSLYISIIEKSRNWTIGHNKRPHIITLSLFWTSQCGQILPLSHAKWAEFIGNAVVLLPQYVITIRRISTQFSVLLIQANRKRTWITVRLNHAEIMTRFYVSLFKWINKRTT